MSTRHTISATAVALGALALVLSAGVSLAYAQEAFAAPTGEPKAPERPGAHIRQDLRARLEIQKEEREEQNSFRDAVRERTGVFKAEVEAQKEAMKGQRDVLRAEGAGMRDEVKAAADARRDAVKAELDAAETPEERTAILEAAKAERDAMQEEALAKREAFRARAETTRTELKTQREALRADVKTKVGERIKSNLESILNRIGTTLETFSDLLGRMNNKVAELSAQGVDTSAATAAISTAEGSLDKAVVALAEARSVFAETLESETPETYKERLRTAVTAATDAVKETHQALRDALKTLMGLGRPSKATEESA